MNINARSFWSIKLRNDSAEDRLTSGIQCCFGIKLLTTAPPPKKSMHKDTKFVCE